MLMRTSLVLRALVGSVFWAGAVGAHASNIGFLSDTPMSYMHSREIDSLLNAAMKALDTKKDGETAIWNNAGMHNSVVIDATFTLSQTTRDGDRTCRNMTATLNAKRQSMTLRPQYCRAGDGPWQLQKQK